MELLDGYTLRVMNIRGDFKMVWNEKQKMIQIDARDANKNDLELLNEAAKKGRKEADLQLFATDERWKPLKFKKVIENGFRYVLRRKEPDAKSFFETFKEMVKAKGYSIAKKGKMLEAAIVPVKGG